MINLFNKNELVNGISYLSKSYPVINKLNAQYGTPNLDRGTKNIFLSLLRSIISQQISTKAAYSVHTKFKALYPENKITPKAVLSTTNLQLKSVGFWIMLKGLEKEHN